MRLAILEDDPDQLALVSRFLKDAGHDVHGFLRGRDIMSHAGHDSFDLFVLDWQVPDVSGTEVMVWIRGNISKTVPILFVTMRSTEEDIVYALERGADDYMVKPVRRLEMQARVNALLRRAFPNEEKALLEFPPFVVDVARRELRRDNAIVKLRPKEFELAVLLFRNVGRLMSRGHLQEAVWGRSADVASRTVDTHASMVRKKLDLGPGSGYQLTPVYQYGYRLERI